MDTRPQLLSHRLIRVGLLAVTVLATPGCHSVVRADRADARIYQDGQYIGTGTADASSTGFPGQVLFTVEADGQRRENPVRRDFRVGTFFVGLFTLYTGWLWCWQLPAEVNVLAPERRAASRWQRNPTEVNPWRKEVAEVHGPRGDPPALAFPVAVPEVPAAPASTPWFTPR